VLLVATVKQIVVRVFAAPDASCAHGSTWSAATRIIGEHLKHRFGDAVQVEHVEMFSARSFEFPEVLGAVRAGGALPVVVVDDRIVSQGGKLSERTIAQAIASLLPPRVQTQETQT
jgi:hypothetical protein